MSEHEATVSLGEQRDPEVFIFPVILAALQAEHENEAELLPDNPLSVVADTMLDMEDDATVLVTDIARHMTELATVVDVHGVTRFVYRSRLDNYPVARSVSDLVLVYAPPTDIWYWGQVTRDSELTAELLATICDYQKMIIPIEIPAFIYGGIQSLLQNSEALVQRHVS